MNSFIKRFTSFVLIVCMLVTFAGCSKDSKEPVSSEGSVLSGDSTPNEENGLQVESLPLSIPSTPENDTDLGLKNIKIDAADVVLTEEQTAVLEYFDTDYLEYPNYEFLRRYPVIFEGAQLHLWGSVKKIISLDSNAIQMVLWLNIGPYELAWGYNELPGYEGAYVLLNGSMSNIAYMEGDTLDVYGRYVGLETLEIDGISYTIPQINMYNAYFDTSGLPGYAPHDIQRADLATVKQVATAVFGEDFEIRKPVLGTDIMGEMADLWDYFYGRYGEEPPYLLVELEDQSNAKFSKFLFGTSQGSIIPIKDGADGSVIERSIEFAADFSHYFLFTFNTDLETLTLEYYDSERNKLWKREFSETVSANYDYTANNIYLTMNNELYIISTETGEDTFAPSYVGEKLAVRKLSDGILLISEGKADGVMKTGLDGAILWKTNLNEEIGCVDSIQLINGNIVLSQDFGSRYLVLNAETGELIQDAVSIS